MDLSETIAPKSDQQNYDDYIGGIQRTVTISAVTKGNAEQPVNIELAEFPGRPFKPNKSMRRLLVVAWGADSSAYIGRRMTLFGNPEVVYGGKAVGGIEIAALSHLEKPLTVALTATRGRKKAFTVQPLRDAPKPAKPAKEPEQFWLDQIPGLDPASLQKLWYAARDGAASEETLGKIFEAANAGGGDAA